MLIDDYELIASLEYVAGKSILSMFHAEAAPSSRQILLLWESPQGEQHHLYLSEAHFFVFCQMIDHQILVQSDLTKNHLERIAEEKWKQIQANNGMLENGREALLLRYYEEPHHKGIPSYFSLTVAGVTIQLRKETLTILPQVAGFIHYDWRSLAALTR